MAKGDEVEVKKAAGQLSEDLSTELVEQTQKILDSLLTKGTLPKDAFGVDANQIDTIYAQAYRLYNTGKYVEALQLFRVLLVLDSSDPKYALGLSACFHMLKEYENAVKAYLMCSMLDPENPLPCFHASDCHIQMKDPASAILFLEMAVERAGTKPEFKQLKERAQMSIESLKKEIEQMGNVPEMKLKETL